MCAEGILITVIIAVNSNALLQGNLLILMNAPPFALDSLLVIFSERLSACEKVLSRTEYMIFYLPYSYFFSKFEVYLEKHAF